MKLIQLPDGAFVRPDTIQSIIPADFTPEFCGCRSFPPRVIVNYRNSTAVIDCETHDHAKELAATLARQVNDELNPPKTIIQKLNDTAARYGGKVNEDTSTGDYLLFVLWTHVATAKPFEKFVSNVAPHERIDAAIAELNAILESE